MRNKDLSRETLLNSIKHLLSCDESHIILDQHKLYTLYSIAFQYMLYLSTKDAGAYILRLENSQLLDKIIQKSKDQTTRNFMHKLSLPRKLKYGQSTFFLDFFNLSSWGMTSEIPHEKIKGAIIVFSASPPPLEDSESFSDHIIEKDYYLNLLLDVCPKTITISYDRLFTTSKPQKSVQFDFIPSKNLDAVRGVRLAQNFDFEED